VKIELHTEGTVGFGGLGELGAAGGLQWEGASERSPLATKQEVSWPLLHTRYLSGDKINENVMGGSCGTYGGKYKCIQGFDRKPEVKRTVG